MQDDYSWEDSEKQNTKMNTQGQIRVLLADDHPLFRDGVRITLGASPEIDVVGQAGSGEEAIKMAKSLEPDVFLLDVSMPDIEGPEVVEACQREGLSCAYLFLTMHKYPALLHKSISLGVRGYVLKDGGAEELVEAVRTVAGGGDYLSPAVGNLLVAEMRDQGRIESQGLSLGDLTPVQRRVVRLVAHDLTSREIGEEMGLSTRTVENHRARICKRLGLSGAHSLIRFAFAHRREL